MKNHGAGKHAIRNREQFRKVVLGRMRSLQRKPDLLRGFFRDPHLRYILELEAEFLGDDLTTREDRHVPKHRLAAIAKTRCLHRGDFASA